MSTTDRMPITIADLPALAELAERARLVPHANVDGYQVEFRVVRLAPAGGGYRLTSDSWQTAGEFPTVQDAEFEVDALRLAGGPAMRVRWRALLDSKYLT